MNFKVVTLFVCFNFLFLGTLNAQVVSISPAFATENDNNVVITFDASQGNAGLLGENVIYAHTGVITDKSTSSTDWKYVIAGWSTNLPKALLSRIGSSNSYTLNIGNIRTYYNVPQGEIIKQLAFVFRNASGTKTGKTAGNGDIFVNINQGVFETKINSPAKARFFNASDNISFSCAASEVADLTLFANGVSLATANASLVLNHNTNASALGNGRINLVLRAVRNGVNFYDSSYIIIKQANTIAATPAGSIDGITYLSDTKVRLQLFAPYKDYVFVVGDFNNWEYDPAFQMKKTPDGSRYWIEIDGLSKGVEYAFQYSIDDMQMKVAEVYAEKILDPWNDSWINAETYPNLKAYPTGKTTDIVSILQTGSAPYQWKTTNFKKPLNDKLVIYECLLRDFIGKHDFKTLKDTISYFKRLGINCVQLMPINEFEGNESWGYNPMFYFAIDKYYGPKNTFKAFVDECHANGIAVVLDVVLNHSFGQNPQVRMYFNPNAGTYGQPTPQNPWFNETDRHPFGVGYDYNHESQETKTFSDRVLKFWIDEYKIDGYRFDLSKGFTQKNTLGNVGAWSAYDQTRVNIWKRIRDEILKYAPDTYLILEHLGDNSEEKVLADMGFMLWGKMTENYAEATMGYNNAKANLSWGNYKSRGFTFPNLVTYAESHDEERIMFTALNYGNSASGYNTKVLSTSLPRVAAYHALLIPLKGPKMLWQGGELGYEVSINTNGRTGNKPFNWSYLNNALRMQTFDAVAKLNRLKQHVSFSSDNYSYDVGGTGKILKVFHDSMNTVIAGNFDVAPLMLSPGFSRTGWWYDYMTGDSANITSTNQTISLNPGAFFVYTDKKFVPQTNQGGSNNIIKAHGSANDMLIYPNPAKDFVLLRFAQSTELHSIQILGVDGKFVSELHPKTVNTEYLVPISALSKGVYYIIAKEANKQFKQRLLVY